MKSASWHPCVSLLLLLCAIAAFYQPRAAAAPYIGRETFTYHQPDGTAFPVKLYGDEFFAYEETASGHVIVKDPATKYWCYARLGIGGFESTGIPVVTKAQNEKQGADQAAQAGVAPKLRLPKDVVLAKHRAMQSKYGVDNKGRPQSPGKGLKATTTGSYVGLALLVDFSDEPGTIPEGEVDAYFNQASGYTANNNACSVREYFDIQSGGLLDYTNIVTAYVRMSRPMTYYDDNTDGTTPKELVEEALDILIAQSFDFTVLSLDSLNSVLCINVFYAGTCASGWSKGLWPHSGGISPKELDAANGILAMRYQMTDMESELRIGTVCHENGHMLCGFPDLYSYIDENPAAVYYYSLMASGNHADGGRHPVNVDPYLKTYAGWTTITEIGPGDCMTASPDATANTFYRYLNPANSREYFMFEVRGAVGYEAAYGGSTANVNPTTGLVAYHILESGSNTHSTITNEPACDYSTPYEVLVLESQPPGNGANPWYLAPSPGSDDAYFSSLDSGVDVLGENTLPALKFWANDGRTLSSNLNVNAVSAAGTTMTFDVGRPAGELLGLLQPASAATAGAQWSLDGETCHDAGDLVSALAPGEYTVSFSEPFGWIAPADEAITIGGSCGAVVSGAYSEVSVSLPVALNAPELVWNSSGSAQWFGQREDAHDGYAAGQSGAVNDSQQSVLATTLSGPGTLRFWWRVSSESDFDYLQFLVDSSPTHAISGITSWALIEYTVPAGSHSMVWTYGKDGSVSEGQDCAWLDEVSFVPDGSPSASLMVGIGPAAAVSAGAQWQLDGGAWQESEATLNLLTPGAYTVSFKLAPGYATPEDLSVVTAASTLTTEIVTYTDPTEGANIITASRSAGFIEEAMALTLTAPDDGTGYIWTYNYGPLADDPPRLTGTATNVLSFDPVLETDAGIYICSRDVAEKAEVATLPYTLGVLPAGSLPIAGLAGLGALAAALGLCGAGLTTRQRKHD